MMPNPFASIAGRSSFVLILLAILCLTEPLYAPPLDQQLAFRRYDGAVLYHQLPEVMERKQSRGMYSYLILPFYNEATTIEDILTAVKEYPRGLVDGVVLTDSEGNDGTSEIVEQFLRSHNEGGFFSVVKVSEIQEKLGVPTTFKGKGSGLQAAAYEILRRATIKHQETNPGEPVPADKITYTTIDTDIKYFDKPNPDAEAWQDFLSTLEEGGMKSSQEINRYVSMRFLMTVVPLIQTNGTLNPVKRAVAEYGRPLNGKKTGGGRATELAWRPAATSYDVFRPLAGFPQPLAGEFSGYLSDFMKMPVPQAFNVETALNLYVYSMYDYDALVLRKSFGPEHKDFEPLLSSLASVGSGVRDHRNKLTVELGTMSKAFNQSFAVYNNFLKARRRAIFDRASADSRGSTVFHYSPEADVCASCGPPDPLVAATNGEAYVPRQQPIVDIDLPPLRDLLGSSRNSDAKKLQEAYTLARRGAEFSFQDLYRIEQYRITRILEAFRQEEVGYGMEEADLEKTIAHLEAAHRLYNSWITYHRKMGMEPSLISFRPEYGQGSFPGCPTGFVD